MRQGSIKPIPSKRSSSRARYFSFSAFSTSLRDRPVVYESQHIDDRARKHSMDVHDRRILHLDECSLQMTNDPNSSSYRRLSEVLGKRIPMQTPANEEENKLKLFENCTPELKAFLKDKDGCLKTKFDKAFIT